MRVTPTVKEREELTMSYGLKRILRIEKLAPTREAIVYLTDEQAEKARGGHTTRTERGEETPKYRELRIGAAGVADLRPGSKPGGVGDG
jgi:hypothetical protein